MIDGDRLETLRRAMTFSVLASYFYVFMEWLFAVTKPSFMVNLSSWEIMSIAVAIPIVPLAAGLCVQLPVGLIFVNHRSSRLCGFLEPVLLVAPSLIMSATVLLMIDNFTYTLFRYNLGRSTGAWRYTYAALFLFLVIWFSIALRGWLSGPFWRRGRKAAFTCCVSIVALSIGVSAANWIFSPGTSGLASLERRASLPNILILSVDGVNARNMSAYGYHRETTPFVKGLLPEALVVENHFTNNEATSGAIASLLSGKYATETRVFHPPDAFTGIHVFQHLPGLLRGLGYRNADIGLRFYADAHDQNMRHAFDVGFGRKLSSEAGGVLGAIQLRFPSELFFLDMMRERIGTRLLHLSGVEDFVNPWDSLWDPRSDRDDDRAAQLRAFIESSSRPFFAHVHFMGTHGPTFHPRRRVFSLGQSQGADWMTDFYDDAILQLDGVVREIVQYLKEIGEYESTLIVLNSDHGIGWATDERLPLIIRFPGMAHRGRLKRNVERIDIAPTIIDYLGAEVPDWMEGRSLLAAESGRLRPCFAFISTESARAGTRAPFYNLRAVQVIVGNRLYRLDLHTGKAASELVRGHTGAYAEGELPSDRELEGLIIEHLASRGYDTSSLRRGG